MGPTFPTKRSALTAGLAVLAAVGALGAGIALAAGTHQASSVTVGVKHTSLGSILYAGSKKLTVYMFSKDHGTKSACDSNSVCVSVWPPVKTSAPKAGAGVSAGSLGTAKEGKFTQATYHGHLLYYYASDKNASGVTGQLRNASGSTGGTPVWFALSASGAKVTKAASAGTTSTPSTTTTGGGGGGGWS